MKLERSDFTTQINKYGYMIYHKGVAVGGAGTNRPRTIHWQHAKKNIQDYKIQSESDIYRMIEKGTIQGYR